jgi:hypothetical protein
MGKRGASLRKSISKRIRLIKSHRIYSTRELAEELGVHPRTVQAWQKEGLEPIDPDYRPFFFRGVDAKAFLIDRHNSKKRPLVKGEFHCLKCRAPRIATAETIYWRPIGNGNRVLVSGTCITCGTMVNRFSSYRSLESGDFGGTFEVAERRIYESRPAIVNTDIGKDSNDE